MTGICTQACCTPPDRVGALITAVAESLALHDTIMAANPPTSALYAESQQRWEALRAALAAVLRAEETA